MFGKTDVNFESFCT